MAKRFIDTNIFSDSWFCDLSKDGKLFFIYYITACDHAGVLRLNRKLFEFQTGIKNADTVIKEFGNCLVTVKTDLYFMPKYIKFQYPDFPKSKVKQQDSAIKILQGLSLWNAESNTYLTVPKELPNSYDNDSDIDSIDDTVVNTIKVDFEIFWTAYQKKIGEKSKLKKKWDALNLQSQKDILEYLPKYISSQPDPKYRKNAETFLNNKSWHDEILGESKPPELVEIDLYLSGNHWRFKGTETALAEARLRGWKDKSQL